MMNRRAFRRLDVCPFIDMADSQCADYLTLRNVTHAFAHCADRYKNCPVYQKLIDDPQSHDPADGLPRLLAAS